MRAIITALLLLASAYTGVAQNSINKTSRADNSTTNHIPVVQSNPGAAFVVYLDFDGYFLDSASSWFTTAGSTERLIAASDLSADEMLYAYNIVAEDFSPFKANVTTSNAVYEQADFNKRIHVVITPDNFTGSWGGIAWVGLLETGEHNVCWVFESALSNSGKIVGDAASHEAGHVVGLGHHGVYDTATCDQIYTYNFGESDEYISWGPIMGASYYASIGTWDLGQYQQCYPISQQDDVASLTNVIGVKGDDISNNRTSANIFNLASDDRINLYSVIERGTLETSTDVDWYSTTLNQKARVIFNLVNAAEIGTEYYKVNTGNVKLRVTIVDAAGNSKLYSLPSKNVVIDSIFEPGEYFIKIEGEGYKWMQKYSSLGTYALFATGEILEAPNNPLIVNAGLDATYEYLPTRTKRTFTFQLQGQIQDDDGDFWYSKWEQQTGPAVQQLSFDSTSGRANITVPRNGEYSFVFSAIDTRGEWSYDTVTITVNYTPNVLVDLGEDLVLCESPDGAALTIESGFPNEFPFQFRWSTGDTTSFIAITESGEYWVMVDSAGIIGSDTVVVTIKPRPSFSITPDTLICTGTSAKLSATASGESAYTYTWSPILNIMNANTATPTVFPTQETTYTVNVVDPNTNCVATASTTVSPRKPVASVRLDGVRNWKDGEPRCFPEQKLNLDKVVPSSPLLQSNIVTGNLTIYSPAGEYSYQVIGINGQVFGRGKLTKGTADYGVSTLHRGVYILKIVSVEKTITYKFFKK